MKGKSEDFSNPGSFTGEPKYVASVSWGKDSVYMLYLILNNPRRYPLDHVVFVNTGMEFDALLSVRDQFLPELINRGIPYTEIDISDEFIFNMFSRGVCRKGTDEVHRTGYGWCGGACRWGTSMKLQALNKFYKNEFDSNDIVEYVGIAYDEQERMERAVCGCGIKIYPLAECEITEAMCLDACYKKGIFWEEEGIKLYEIMDRLSCFCCRNKSLRELKAIYYHLPKYFDRLLEMEKKIGESMKGEGMSLLELKQRYIKEGYHLSIFDIVDYPKSLCR